MLAELGWPEALRDIGVAIAAAAAYAAYRFTGGEHQERPRDEDDA